MYNILISKKKEAFNAVYKWHEEGFRFCDSDQGSIFEPPFKTTKNPNITGYNFNLFHRIIATNYNSSKLKLKDT